MRSSLQRIRALMIKEFLALLKDKRSRIIVFVPPIVQLLVFGYAATFDLNRIPFAVYNEDPGSAARDLVARFIGSPNFRQVAAFTREAEVAPQVDASTSSWCCTSLLSSAASCSAAGPARCRSS